MTISMIAAVSLNGVIGKDNKLPFDYPEDMKLFRQMTKDSTIIMGRKTFESIGNKPLPKRQNIVVTRSPLKIEGVETADSLDAAIKKSIAVGTTGYAINSIWLIGGSNIYREGLKFADEIYTTLIPEVIEGDDVALFPWISPKQFYVHDYITLPSERSSPLQVAHYKRVSDYL